MITKEQIKNTGATFTPKELADFLSSRLALHIKGNNLKILDPACGDGELLISIGKNLNSFEFELNGFDENSYYLEKAKERLSHFKATNLIKANFLKAVDLTHHQLSFEFSDTSTSKINKAFDIVIANPPYVRTQILGSDQAQELAKKFNLKGRVDLYYPFLIAMTESLKENGILGVITSNRYLFTKSGESVRKFLFENYQILELIDLGDTKLFDAAVLPAIFIGRKKKNFNSLEAKFTKIYEEHNPYRGQSAECSNVYEILTSEKTGYFKFGSKLFKKTNGKLKCNTSKNFSWDLLSISETSWVSQIDKNKKNRIDDFFKVRVGIKTTADKIFISDKWDKMENNKPEEELLKELISQENIKPWAAKDNTLLKVLYPHFSDNGVKRTINIDKYPNAKQYFLNHEEKLKSRKYLIEAGREWFEIWVPHNPEFWELPKLVFPDISLKPRFYFDKGGRIVNGNCYWIVAKNIEEIEKLYLIQGIANSKLMTKYHDLVFNNKLYSGRRRYFTQYVEKYPLPDYESPIAKEIIEIVKKLNFNLPNSETAILENELEVKVAEAFGVEPIFNLD